jgi:hypothetical protein
MRICTKETPYLFFEAFLPNPTESKALPQPYPKMWKSLREWFMEQCHENGKLLRVAMNSNVPETVKVAESTQDALLKSGRFEYRDLAEASEQ